MLHPVAHICTFISLHRIVLPEGSFNRIYLFSVLIL